MTTIEPLRTSSLDNRSRAFLRAVADGRATLTLGSEPDLFIDRCSCGDQFSAHHLVHRGYITPEREGRWGELVPALLTSAGRLALEN